MKKVTKLEPVKQVSQHLPIPTLAKRRVAGYARVSTDHDDQATSYEAQVQYYTSYITGRTDWEFVGMYSDEGISGTSTKRRTGFRQMVDDALKGKIDLIITKSVSRFARNTVDSLTTVRQLKEAGVEIYFEKENIWTFDAKGELLITIMSSLAQEESRSISENVTWGRRRQLAQGKVTFSYSQVMGFRQKEGGGFEIDPEEAKIVRYIFQQVLLGINPNRIASDLTQQGIPTPAGKSRWSYGTVKRMLRNEKYKGDALLQKHFTVDFLTKRQKANEGELPQYYVEDSHDAIVDRETFDAVQVELDRLEQKRQTGNHFSGKLICGDCGSSFGSKVWHSTSKYKRTIYQCRSKYKGKDKCSTPHFTETQIKDLFVQGLNRLLVHQEEVLSNLSALLQIVGDCSTFESTISTLEKELSDQHYALESLIDRHARTNLPQEDFQERYESLARNYSITNDNLSQAQEELASQKHREIELKQFIDGLANTPHLVETFDLKLWQTMVDKVIIRDKEHVCFHFRDGSQIDL
ncbi:MULTISPECIES: recombinase family protein [unclassified Streptococcus]|uniref:recombinase family protein n=1 Tax=unclassified Streptococcus TaxID=2608887 RepID=UPI00359DAC59